MKVDNNIYEICKKHMHAYVLAEMNDGTKVDGIITGLDDDHVYLAVPKDCSNQHQRNYGYGSSYGYGSPGYGYGYGPGYGYGGYGPGYGYGGYPRPGQRFERFILPLAAIAAISLLPWY